MLEKIKESCSNTILTIIGVLTTAVAILLYILSNKRKEVDSLKAQVDLIDTQRKADLLEVQIKERLQNKDLLDQETKELQKTLGDLETKRKQISSEENKKNSTEVEDFWRNS